VIQTGRESASVLDDPNKMKTKTNLRPPAYLGVRSTSGVTSRWSEAREGTPRPRSPPACVRGCRRVVEETV